jgi:probable phosphoglycerate mutase
LAVTTFFLVRHAERDTGPDLLPGRAAGIRLTERGRGQAERVSVVLAARGIDGIVSSPLERALETADPLAKATGLRVEIASGFNEFDFGAWTGRRASELDRDPLWRQFNCLRSMTRTPGGEVAGEVQARFVAELLRLHDANPDGRVACFSHADPIRFALVHFLGAPLDFFDRIEIDLGSITTLTIAGWGTRVVRLNEVP